MKLLIATNNQGKVLELGRLMHIPQLELVMPADIGLNEFDVEETGQTYLENATLKAVAFARESGLYALADDSGLEVEALNGEPGVYSKRYAGEGATNPERIAFLQRKIEERGSSNRKARFVAVLVLSSPAGEVLETATGYCEGEIGYEMRGENGFGYDPVFIPGLNGRTMAELTDEEKDSISHRGNAARLIAPKIVERFF